MEKVRSSQLLPLRKKFKGEVEIVSVKDKVAQKSLSTLKIPGIEKLAEKLVGQCVLMLDRKSTRLNSSHPSISYAVFCLKKKRHEQHWDKRGLCLYRYAHISCVNKLALLALDLFRDSHRLVVLSIITTCHNSAELT